jgi:hypothetical protein
VSFLNILIIEKRLGENIKHPKSIAFFKVSPQGLIISISFGPQKTRKRKPPFPML